MPTNRDRNEMGWSLDDLKAAHPDAPEELVEEFYHARQQAASGSARAEQVRAEQARKKIEAVTGKPFGTRKGDNLRPSRNKAGEFIADLRTVTR